MWIIFSACAVESAGSTSDSPPDFEQLARKLEPSAWWKGKLSRSQLWEKRCKKGGWISVLSGAEMPETYPFKNYPGLTGTSPPIHASRSRLRAKEKGKTTTDIFGPPSENTFLIFDQEDASSRTSPDTFRSVSEMSSKTWKDLVSDVRLACTQRRKSAPRIEGNGSSSSAWPTPTAHLSKEGAYPAEFTRNTPTLTACVNWPTPTTAEAGKISCRANYGQVGLSNHPAIQGLPKRTKTFKGGPLPPEASSLTNPPGLLNANWVEMLMGFPIGFTDLGRSETP